MDIALGGVTIYPPKKPTIPDFPWWPPDPENGHGDDKDDEDDPVYAKPDQDDKFYIAVLKTNKSQIPLMEPYTLSVSAYSYTTKYPQHVNITEHIEKAEISIRRKDRDTYWKTLSVLQTGTTSYTRTAITPGYFSLKADVWLKWDKEKPITSWAIEVEEMYPDINVFKNHSVVTSRAREVWDRTVAFTQANRGTNQTREYGSLIYLNTSTGGYSVGIIKEGPVVTLSATTPVTASVSFSWNDYIIDPRQPGEYVVGSIHSHFPLQWAPAGCRRKAGPSDDDNNSNIPGVLYDYKDDIRGGNPVVNTSNPMRYWEYGPFRKETLK